MSRKPEQFTEDNFATEVLESSLPVLVDFSAEWCGPCRVLTPVIDELANSVGDNAKIGKVNVNDEPQLAQTYGIHTIPTVLVFQDGQVVERLGGVNSKQRYEQALDMTAVPA